MKDKITKNNKKNKLLGTGIFLFGFLAAIAFMRFWQGQCCPYPEMYDYNYKAMSTSDWLGYWKDSSVYWVNGALISLAILVVFIVLAIILSKVIKFRDRLEILTEISEQNPCTENKLKLLKEKLNQNIITQEEYNAQRAEIISKL